MTPRTHARAPRRLLLLLGASLLLAAGCGTSDSQDTAAREDAPDEPAATVEEGDLEDGDVEPESLPLEEVEESGVEGTARVRPGSGRSIEVEVELTGDGVEPTHGIEARLGSCEDALSGGATEEVLGGATSYTLADVEDGTMRDEAELPEELVSEGTYSLVVYAGEDVEGDIAACADVEVE